MISTDAEIARLLYKYRRLILEGKISLPPDEAAKLIGPDRAYHLYISMPGPHSKKAGRRKK